MSSNRTFTSVFTFALTVSTSSYQWDCADDRLSSDESGGTEGSGRPCMDIGGTAAWGRDLGIGGGGLDGCSPEGSGSLVKESVSSKGSDTAYRQASESEELPRAVGGLEGRRGGGGPPAPPVGPEG